MGKLGGVMAKDLNCRCSPHTEPADPLSLSTVCSRRTSQVDTGHCGMDTQSRPIDSGSPLLTDEEACNYLRIRQRQLYSWRMQGVIPFISIGRSIRYRLRDLDAAIAAMTVVSLADATRKSGNNVGQTAAETPAPNPNPVPQP